LPGQAALTATYSGLAAVVEPLLATEEASIIVAASRPPLDLLGYQHEGELLGRRVIVVMPARFQQATSPVRHCTAQMVATIFSAWPSSERRRESSEVVVQETLRLVDSPWDDLLPEYSSDLPGAKPRRWPDALTASFGGVRPHS
jgi:hypothetical protein